MAKISLNELARMLGVSKTLISLVLNGKGDEYGISQKTQERVTAMAQQMNYRPNLMARGLRTGKSNVIGVVVADISNVFYSTISKSIEQAAAQYGYHIMVCSTDEDSEREKQLIDMLVNEQNVNGLIVSTTQKNAEQFQRLRDNGQPLVLVDRSLKGFDVDYVGVDNYTAAYEAAMHLVKIGYSKIGMLTITPTFLSTITERAQGFRDALKKSGLHPSRFIRDIPFGNTRDEVFKAVKELISPPHAIDALFVVNNNLAAFALECLNETGLRIPQDVAVVSFDDVEYFRFTNPAVTAVAQPLEEMGKKSLELLVKQIQAGKKKLKPHKLVLPARLIVRKSCGSFLKK